MKAKSIFILACLMSSLSMAQSPMADLVEAALDQPMDYKATDTPILKLFEEVSGQTGIQIGFAPGVVELLPHGVETRIQSVELSGLSLRKGLRNLLDPLGMTFAVDDQGVLVFPIPAIQRLGHRMTWDEIEVLETLRRIEPGRNKEHLDLLMGMTRQAGKRIPLDWSAILREGLSQGGAGNGIELLEAICPSLSLIWFPKESKVIVMSLSDYYASRLESWVTIREQNAPLKVFLNQISIQSGVPVRLSAYLEQKPSDAILAPFTIMAENATATEVLDQVAATTGLVWLIEDRGVILQMKKSSNGMPSAGISSPMKNTSNQRRARDLYVAKITLPDPEGKYEIEFLIRESELSPEARRLRKQLMKEADGIIIQALQKHFEESSVQVSAPEELKPVAEE